MKGNPAGIEALKERLALLERENRVLSDRNLELEEYMRANRKGEDALREKEELFRTVTEFSSDWLFWRRGGGTLVYASPACERITGYAPEEFSRDPDLFSRVIHPEDRETWASHCREVDEKAIPGTLTFRILTKDGETRWILHACRPVFDEKGTFHGMIGSNHDITRDKKLEEEAWTARKMEAVGVLAGGIAHDFNNLLTVIIGNISLLKQLVPENHPWRVRLAEAENASLKACDLANRLITFSGGGAPIRETVPVAPLIEEVCRRANPKPGVRFEVKISEGLPDVSIDEAQIRQVLDVLILNAGESMPGGGAVKIRVGTGRDPTDAQAGPKGTHVEIAVEDQGVGIEECNLHRVFDPFFTTKNKSGLGLAAAYSILQRHGGSISVDSRVEEGTVFTVRLPVAEAPRKAMERADRPVPKGERRKVLVMDDDHMLRAVILDILDTIGYEGSAVADGREAVNAYLRAMESGRTFDAVILDLSVPEGMGGVDAVARILEADPGARVIVSSGYSNASVMSEYDKYGFLGVITKPYRIQDLRDILKKVMTDPRGTPA